MSKKHGLLESELQASIADYARLLGWRLYHNARADGNLRGGRGALGFPDLILVRDLWPASNEMIAAEIKVGKRLTTPTQREWLRLFDRVEGCTAVLWRDKPAPLTEPWLDRVETWEGDALGAIGKRLRGEQDE